MKNFSKNDELTFWNIDLNCIDTAVLSADYRLQNASNLGVYQTIESYNFYNDIHAYWNDSTIIIWKIILRPTKLRWPFIQRNSNNLTQKLTQKLFFWVDTVNLFIFSFYKFFKTCLKYTNNDIKTF